MVVNQNIVEGGPQPPPFVATAVEDASVINWEKVMYVVFDLETTGLDKEISEIIEIAAVVLDPNGIRLEDGHFLQLVKPSSAIPFIIIGLTTISNEDVRSAERFPAVADAFIQFVGRCAEEYSVARSMPIHHIILVAHNGRRFDIPILKEQLSKYQMLSRFFSAAALSTCTSRQASSFARAR